MFACVDVGYHNSGARAAAVTFERWENAATSGEYFLDITDVEPYVPGNFYRRELPCLLKVLDKVPTRPDIIVIDGYVWLDDDKRPGLGGHLFAALDKFIPVIGVAKNQFATATGAIEVLRGSSARPLYVTAAGMEQDEAAACIRRMHGKTRIPTLLRRVDQFSRHIEYRISNIEYRNPKSEIRNPKSEIRNEEGCGRWTSLTIWRTERSSLHGTLAGLQSS